MGPADVTPVHVPYPAATDLQIRIIADGCQIRIRPGEGEEWVSGTYHDPSGQRSAKLAVDGGTLTIDHVRVASHPLGELLAGEPAFDLALGRARPYALTIESAAIESDAELGGLPLTGLAVRQRAGRTQLSFGEPNPHSAQSVRLSADGAAVEVRNLANANASEISLTGDAARYGLDFGGALARDSHAQISVRASSVDITVPSFTAARICPVSVLGDVDAGDGFTRREGAYWTSPVAAADRPLLTIDVSVEAGQLKLRLRDEESPGATAT